ncbi:MAG: type II toxin-antitoxin system HicB family antitoxin [Nitrospirota bacterium]
MREKLTAVYQKSPYGYIGYVEELPGANTQGSTIEETRKNLVEAVQLILEANRLIAEKDILDKEIIKEDFGILTV